MRMNQRQPPDSSIALLLALLLFGIYLLSFNGRITSSDGLSMFAVTDSVVKRGDFATDQMWTFFGTKSEPAPDGEVYSKYGYGASLFAAPFYALALYTGVGGLMQVTLLSSALAVALTGALVYLTARRFAVSPSVSVLLALLFGVATPAWVYAKEFWSEPFAALTLFAAFYFLILYRAECKTRDALLAGICLGLALAIRTTNVLLVPLYLLYAFADFPPPSPGREILPARSFVAFSIPVALFLASVLLYNDVRFSSPLTTGYRADENFSNNILLGAYGFLFSPGKGLFVYAPFLAALPFGVLRFYKSQKRELAFISALFAFHLVLFSAWYYWWGGTNWAARFLVPTLPFLVLLCAPLLRLLFESRATPALQFLRLTFLVLVAVSLVNALAGVVVNSLTYRLRAVTLSPNPDWDSIFAPSLSPLIGHWQTLKPTNLDVAWIRATPESAQVDWLVLLLTALFIVWCALHLVRLLKGAAPRPWQWTFAVALCLLVVPVSMVRYADDPRLGGGDGYAALLQTLARESNARDLLVLNDDAHARFFLNANRAPLKWYGLSRDPARWDEPARSLIASQITAHPRVWFAYDDRVDAPNPMRDWFAANLRETARFQFPDGVSLVAYEGR